MHKTFLRLLRALYVFFSILLCCILLRRYVYCRYQQYSTYLRQISLKDAADLKKNCRLRKFMKVINCQMSQVKLWMFCSRGTFWKYSGLIIIPNEYILLIHNTVKQIFFALFNYKRFLNFMNIWSPSLLYLTAYIPGRW